MAGSDNRIQVHNYATAFIDLLGQKAALEGCGLLPESKDEVIRVTKDSIGVILDFHRQFQEFYSAMYESPDRSRVPPQHRDTFARLQRTELKFQRFSDGLVAYLSLAPNDRHLPVNGIYGLVSSTGALALIGLATGQPIRGGIDIAWGVELNQNELYGCVVARSYHLESVVARYPRIVLGKEVMNYLHQHANFPGTSLDAQYVREMAATSLEMTYEADDGEFAVDYLGPAFRRYIGAYQDGMIYREAHAYAIDQLEKARASGDSKLTERYSELIAYFDNRKDAWAL